MSQPMRDCPVPRIDEELEPTHDAPRAARHAVRTLGERTLPAWRRGDLDLLVTELVSNSLLHARPGRVAVKAAAIDGTLRVEVWDAGPGIDRRDVSMPSPAAHQGRGLPLLDRLSDSWGTERHGARACVWFEMGAEAPPA